MSVTRILWRDLFMNVKQLIFNMVFFYLFTAHPVVLRHLRGDHKISS